MCLLIIFKEIAKRGLGSLSDVYLSKSGPPHNAVELSVPSLSVTECLFTTMTFLVSFKN